MALALPLYDYQEKALKFALGSRYSIIALEMGLGKAQNISSPVYTPSGPRPIGDINPGDYVLGVDGKKKKVLGIYPQGIKDIYEVVFNDGSTTKCCEDHLWSVRTPQHKLRGKPFKAIPLKYLATDLKIPGVGNKWGIPQLSSPCDFETSALEIDPYLLGVLIGDGSLSHNGTRITNGSDFIYQKIACLIPQETKICRKQVDNTYDIRITGNTRGGNSLLKEIRDLKLDVISKTKFIPNKYKYTSFKNRLRLLQGILDTDGYVSKEGTLQFSSASEKLCDDVRETIETLGGISRKSFKRAKCQTGIFDSWTLTISMPPGIIPVTKPCKLSKYLEKTKYPPQRYIKEVRLYGKEECVCISVEGSHYLTDHCIVTHNTPIAIAIKDALPNQKRCLVLCPASLTLNWRKEIFKFLPDAAVSVFRKRSDFYYPVDSDFVVCSYDMAIKHPYLFEWASMLIMDECTQIKDLGTYRTETIHKLIFENSIPRVHLLSGTPIKNRIKEYYSLIAICNYDPKIKKSAFLEKFPDHNIFADRFSFRKEYDIYFNNRRRKVVKWDGLQREHELKAWLHGIYISMKSDLPPINYRDVFLEDFNDEALLEEFLNNTHDLEGTKSPIKMAAALRKVPLTVKYVRDMRSSGTIDGPVIIYTDHVESCEQLAIHFNTDAITGKMAVARRQLMADRFQEGELDVLCATYGAFSEGYTLHKSNFIAANDYPWSPGAIKQAAFRINRKGQTRPCHFHRIFGSAQDEYIFKTVMEKQKVLDAMF